MCTNWCAPGVCPGAPSFLTYINGIAELSLSAESKLVIYADDILFYRPIRQLLQHDVNHLTTNDDYIHHRNLAACYQLV